MGTLTGTYIASKVHELMVDFDGDTYTSDQLVEWINEAQRAVCLVRPDAKVSTSILTLVAGVKQSLPAASRRLMRITMNMSSGDYGTATRGAPVNGPINMRLWDRYDETWAAVKSPAPTAVEEYAYALSNPTVFWVRPGMVSGTALYLEAELADLPTDLSVIGDSIDLKDVYSPPIINYVAACFLLRDDERTPNHIRGQYHMQQFFTLLGVKTQAEALVAPELVEETT